MVGREDVVEEGGLAGAEVAGQDSDGSPQIRSNNVIGQGLFPRQQRDMNDIAAAANRVDGVMRVFKTKAVGRDQIKFKAFGVQLLQCKLAALKIMASGRFYGDVLVANFS